MKRAKELVGLGLVITLLSLPCLSAREKPAQQFEEQRQAEEAAKQQEAQAQKAKKQEQKQQSKIQLVKARLPEDKTARVSVKEVRFSGNTLVSTQKLVADMPIIFNASDKPIDKADSEYLYDFTTLREVLATPGEPREVSIRTIQGLTQYVLSVYRQKNFGGIYVYIPAEALKEGTELKGGILPVSVIESHVSSVDLKYFDVNQTVVQKGRLDANAMLAWSPVKQGQVVKRKKLDDFINLLNLNPDRYVSAGVSKGAEPNALAVTYDIYEANPWHWFMQVDNSGTRERQWNPRIGLINSNLLGFDDSFFAMYQFKPDSSWQDNYSLFGSYDFPVAGPGLRLNVYGGYSEFDLSPQASDIDFVGAGKFIGADLRYNMFQTDGWFFDVIGSYSHEESRIIPSLFPEFLSSNVKMELWGVGLEIHKRDDVSNSSFAYKHTQSMGGSGEKEFVLSRTGAEKDFSIDTFSAGCSRLLDPNKVTRLSANLKYVLTSDRLTPAKMTPFGGMYSVRGYKEYEIIADGGVLASVQYEFDVIRYDKLKETSREEADRQQTKEKGLKKLAPLAFADFGRTMINDPVGDERKHQTLLSVGPGIAAEYGDNLSGAVYYGFPLKETPDTDRGKGRVNASVTLRW